MTRPRLVLPPFMLLLALAVVPAADARPAHRRALVDHFGTFLAKELHDCRTCHVPGQGDDKVKPHNAFGARLKALGEERRQAGKGASLLDRFEAIRAEDSDGDGVDNLTELLTGHQPGEQGDRPAADHLARAAALVREFDRATAGYPWRPFDRVVRPPVPQVTETAGGGNEIDAFLAVERAALGLKPRPEAPKHVLLRRLYVDLTGLPPTPEALHAFLDDPAPDAYERLVERLLNSPRFGERWGRHWMDVWRYSDWAGYGAQVRDSQPHVWRWRDWIVEAVNADKPYDRMILEMLAADELWPDDPQALRATGYLVRNYKLLSREKWMQDVVEHTCQAFLGLTLKCAKCHDHMYDPLTQKEYYQFRAIFEPHHVRTDRLPGEADVAKVGLVRAYDKDAAAPTYLFERGDDRFPDKSQALPPGVPEALGGLFRVEPVPLPRTAAVPDKRDFVVRETIAASAAALAHARDALTTARDKGTADLQLPGLEVILAEAKHQALLAVLDAEKLEDTGRKDSPEWKEAAGRAVTLQRRAAELEARKGVLTGERELTRLEAADKKDAAKVKAARENLDKSRQALVKAEAEAKQPVTTQYRPRVTQTYPATSTGRRTALAKWLAHRDNPLTARVAVNHVWLRHFGQALVPTTFDFGRNGQRPTHPALLDWLAAELMEHGWSLRHLHRLILTSNAYRADSTPDAANLKVDPDNKYFWRVAPRRAEAEVVRDSIFHVAGRLDLAMGGPDIPHPQGLTTPRRSLYFQLAAERSMPFLEIFDGPNVTECYERKHVIVPQQALALHNSELARKHARLLARDLHTRAGASDSHFVTLAFERLLSRAPTEAETEECVGFLRGAAAGQGQRRTPGNDGGDGATPAADPTLRARESLVHVLLNHHEFVTIR